MRAVSSHLLRRQQELYELTAHHSQLSGFRMVQLQAAVQLTAGLVEEEQPLYKPAHKPEHIHTV